MPMFANPASLLTMIVFMLVLEVACIVKVFIAAAAFSPLAIDKSEEVERYGQPFIIHSPDKEFGVNLTSSSAEQPKNILTEPS